MGSFYSTPNSSVKKDVGTRRKAISLPPPFFAKKQNSIPESTFANPPSPLNTGTLVVNRDRRQRARSACDTEDLLSIPKSIPFEKIVVDPEIFYDDTNRDLAIRHPDDPKEIPNLPLFSLLPLEKVAQISSRLCSSSGNRYTIDKCNSLSDGLTLDHIHPERELSPIEPIKPLPVPTASPPITPKGGSSEQFSFLTVNEDDVVIQPPNETFEKKKTPLCQPEPVPPVRISITVTSPSSPPTYVKRPDNSPSTPKSPKILPPLSPPSSKPQITYDNTQLEKFSLTPTQKKKKSLLEPLANLLIGGGLGLPTNHKVRRHSDAPLPSKQLVENGFSPPKVDKLTTVPTKKIELGLFSGGVSRKKNELSKSVNLDANKPTDIEPSPKMFVATISKTRRMSLREESADLINDLLLKQNLNNINM